MANLTAFCDLINATPRESHIFLSRFSNVKSSSLVYLNTVKGVMDRAMLKIFTLWEAKPTWHNLQKAQRQLGIRGVCSSPDAYPYCSRGEPHPLAGWPYVAGLGWRRSKVQGGLMRRQRPRQDCGFEWPIAKLGCRKGQCCSRCIAIKGKGPWLPHSKKEPKMFYILWRLKGWIFVKTNCPLHHAGSS